jgi:carbon monoxide dehydrogenase subunit G
MGRVTRSLEIARPIDLVFRVISRVEELPRWLPEVSEASRIDPELGPGSRVSLRLGPAGGGTRITGTVTAWAPPGEFAVGGSGGPLRIRVQALLTPAGDGTAVQVAIDIEAAPMLAFIVREAERRIGAELPAALERLRALAEAEPA